MELKLYSDYLMAKRRNKHLDLNNSYLIFMIIFGYREILIHDFI